MTTVGFEIVDDFVHGDMPALEEMSSDEVLTFLEAVERKRRWLDAVSARALARLADNPDPLPVATNRAEAGEFLRDEVALALGISFGVAHDRITVAQLLLHVLPHTLNAMEAGDISYLKGAHLAKAVRSCDPAVAAQIEARVLPRAAEQNLPAFQKAVSRAVLALDPADRHAEAAKSRAVTARTVEDGMGLIQALVPAVDMTTIMLAVNTIADTFPKDERTVDQRRADALTDICAAVLTNDVPTLTCGTRQGRPVSVELTISLAALLGLSTEPAELAGYGPVPADVVRALGFDESTKWRTLITDDAGHLLDYGRTTYTPPQALKDFVVARDRTCVLPNCQRAARTCDIDHGRAYADGGSTSACNCHCLCPHHHKMKHEGGWTLEVRTDGTIIWTSPTGRVYEHPPTVLPH